MIYCFVRWNEYAIFIASADMIPKEKTERNSVNPMNTALFLHLPSSSVIFRRTPNIYEQQRRKKKVKKKLKPFNDIHLI